MKTLNMVWWMILIQGLALLLLGIMAVAWPNITLVIAAYIFALYILIAGIVNTIHGISGISARKGWFLSLILGLAQIFVSIYVLRNPSLTLAVFILVVGFTFLIQGVMEIIVAFIDKGAGQKTLDIIAGVLGIFAGFFILRYPVTGGMAFIWIVGVYGIVVGTIQLALAISVHHELKEIEAGITKARVR
jgi:uncharacterized membrane protein HdeD (DUF308 family)